MSSKNPLTYAVAGVAAVALAFGAYALGNSKSDGGSAGTAQAAQFGPGGQAPAGQAQSGQMPPGFGTPATGADAEKAKKAALAKYDGTVEQVMKLDDGSYVVHVITSDGEQHVAVSEDFEVTGAEQGGPGGGGMPPQGAAPPSGTVPPSGSAAPPSGSGSGTGTGASSGSTS